jgi:ferredoxin
MDFKNDKEELARVAQLMNEQSETPMLATDDLLLVMDAALEPEEVAFLLKMGGGSLTLDEVKSRVDLPEQEFTRILENLLDKGHVTELQAELGSSGFVYHVMSILPGWFEVYLMRGTETPDRRLFAERLSKYFSAASDFDPEVINAVLRDTAPHRSIAVINPPQPRLLTVDQAVPAPSAEIHPPHSVLNILEGLDENETVAVGHCFCRQQRKLSGDPCRMGLPRESCMSLGPAADHLIRRGIARPITREEAIELMEEVEAKGVVHQVGRVVPLKDLKPKYEVDVICNCCWDCCGAIGNYSRGNIPFMLKSYYIAEIPAPDRCTGCGICEQYCPVSAISVGEAGTAAVRAEMCCGCGLCAFHCPEEVVELKPLERDVFLPILDKSRRRISP